MLNFSDRTGRGAVIVIWTQIVTQPHFSIIYYIPRAPRYSTFIWRCHKKKSPQKVCTAPCAGWAGFCIIQIPAHAACWHERPESILKSKLVCVYETRGRVVGGPTIHTEPVAFIGFAGATAESFINGLQKVYQNFPKRKDSVSDHH
jgi:hypothetical protein